MTCGTVAKRAFLLEAFPQLDDVHIGDSRSCSFEALIKRQTNGAGVHLALNSLADDKLQVCAKGYRGYGSGVVSHLSTFPYPHMFGSASPLSLASPYSNVCHK